MSARSMVMAAAGGSGPLNWFNFTGTSGNDYGASLVLDSSGNVYALGQYPEANPSFSQSYLAKYNSTGVLQWQRRIYHTAGYNVSATTVALDNAGNVFVLCAQDAASSPTTSNHFVVLKYNSSGTLQWKYRYYAPADYNDISPSDMAIDSSGYIYVCANVSSNSRGAMFKLASDGSQYQQTRFPNYNYGYGCAVDSSGNFFMCGAWYDTGTGDFSGLIAKVATSSGVSLTWLRRPDYYFDTSRSLSYQAITLDASGNSYVAAISTISSTGQQKGIVAKYDSSGTRQWMTEITQPSSQNLALSDIAVDASGNTFVVGRANLSGFVAKLDSSGTAQWMRTVSKAASTNASLNSVKLSSDGKTVFAIGYANISGSGGNDAFVMTLPSDGTKTGTYGTLIYAAATASAAGYTPYSEGAGSVTIDTPSVTTNDATNTNDGAGSLTSTTTFY